MSVCEKEGAGLSLSLSVSAILTLLCCWVGMRVVRMASKSFRLHSAEDGAAIDVDGQVLRPEDLLCTSLCCG